MTNFEREQRAINAADHQRVDMEEILRQALNALEYHTQQTRPIHNTELAIDALRAVLNKEKP